jgi:hypothetical protein
MMGINSAIKRMTTTKRRDFSSAGVTQGLPNIALEPLLEPDSCALAMGKDVATPGMQARALVKL